MLAIVRHASELAEILDNLTATDIGRLADTGLLRSHMPAVESLAQLALGASDVLAPPRPPGQPPAIPLAPLHGQAGGTPRPMQAPPEPKGWQVPQRPATAMALEVLSALVALKAYDPGRPVSVSGQGGFTPLLREAFQVLGVAGNPKAVAAAAERIWNDRQRTPSVEGGFSDKSDKLVSVD